MRCAFRFRAPLLVGPLAVATKSARAIAAALALGALNVTEETSRIILPSATGFAARQAIAILRKHNVPIASLVEPRRRLGERH